MIDMRWCLQLILLVHFWRSNQYWYMACVYNNYVCICVSVICMWYGVCMWGVCHVAYVWGVVGVCGVVCVVMCVCVGVCKCACVCWSLCVCYHKSWRLHAIHMEWWLICLTVCVLLLELLVSTMSFIPHYWILTYLFLNLNFMHEISITG